MASISCYSTQLPTNLCIPTTSPTLKLRNGFLGISRNPKDSSFRPSSSVRLGPSCGGKTKCWFNLNNRSAEGAGIYGSQTRDDFDRDDVEQYFNYMGMLAVEGTYDKMEALLSQNIHPVDILMLMAASEADKPKIEELLRAGAKYDIKDADGRTALDRAADDDTRNFILNFSK